MIFELHNQDQANHVMKTIWPAVKQNLADGHRMRVEIKRSTRSTGQNDMFHAIIDKVHKAMKVAGSTWSADDWKRLLIDQWASETNRKIGKVAPSLDGERVVQLGWQSHKFTIPDAADFIEWLLAWSAEKGIDL